MVEVLRVCEVSQVQHGKYGGVVASYQELLVADAFQKYSAYMLSTRDPALSLVVCEAASDVYCTHVQDVVPPCIASGF